MEFEYYYFSLHRWRFLMPQQLEVMVQHIKAQASALRATWLRLSRKLTHVAITFTKCRLLRTKRDIFFGIVADSARIDDQPSSCSVSDKR
ncbi:MAG: hypothetical protein AAF349_25510 [Cyanobacteria bacterium P01_A01_bin.68]